MNPFFPDVRKYVEDENSQNTRSFQGTGKNVLFVAGLLALHSVRVDRKEIPIEQDMLFPDNVRFAQKHTVPIPLILLTKDEEGKDILLRSVVSNDGIWQEGSTIFVTGDWADVVASTETLEPATAEKK